MSDDYHGSGDDAEVADALEVCLETSEAKRRRSTLRARRMNTTLRASLAEAQEKAERTSQSWERQRKRARDLALSVADRQTVSKTLGVNLEFGYFQIVEEAIAIREHSMLVALRSIKNVQAAFHLAKLSHSTALNELLVRAECALLALLGSSPSPQATPKPSKVLQGMDLAHAEAVAENGHRLNHAGYGCTSCGSFWNPTGWGSEWHKPGCSKAEPQATPKLARCDCGEPTKLGITHRIGDPCFRRKPGNVIVHITPKPQATTEKECPESAPAPHPARPCSLSYPTRMTCECRRTPSPAREDLAKRDVNQCFKGRTFKMSDGSDGCAECCNGDRCDDATHRDRERCFYCYGTGKPIAALLGRAFPPPSKSEAEIRAEVWEAAAERMDFESKEAMMMAGKAVTQWFCEIQDRFRDKAKSLRAASVEKPQSLGFHYGQGGECPS